MIKSMTGFGKSTCQLDGSSVAVEVRSLNSKTLDVSLKIPGNYREKEQIIRNLAGQVLVRGKVEVHMAIENFAANTDISINRPLLEKYYRELVDIAEGLQAPLPNDLITTITRFPEVLKQSPQEENEEQWMAIEQAIREAMEQADAFRQSEGAHLAEDLHARIEVIRNLLGQIAPLESQRIETLKGRLLKGLSELKDAGTPDPNRFEQELIFYLEKLDITEEKVRLAKHLDYFEDTMRTEEIAGKKLGFISQEIGREINTIGSKANDADIQKFVVQMKDELEKVKEQLLNIL
ncbi:MAG: YicC/YloC family endoribonuclease [Bacteroides sp.]|jgi:uncharacterized protein (TIGR00255 family)|nr:YicC/YloC family endoribonuclease [Bacteroides sp.]